MYALNAFNFALLSQSITHHFYLNHERSTQRFTVRDPPNLMNPTLVSFTTDFLASCEFRWKYSDYIYEIIAVMWSFKGIC